MSKYFEIKGNRKHFETWQIADIKIAITALESRVNDVDEKKEEMLEIAKDLCNMLE